MDAPLPRMLHGDRWPDRARRAAQLGHSAWQWFFGCAPRMVVAGEGLPAAKGFITEQPALDWRHWRAGALVLCGASFQRLRQALHLDANAPVQVYLADADVLVVMGQRDHLDVVVHVSGDASRLDRYADGNQNARRKFQAIGQQALIPTILARGQIGSLYWMAQSRLPGHTPHVVSAERLVALVSAALRPLSALQSAAQVTPLGTDREMLEVKLPPLLQIEPLREHVEQPLRLLRQWRGRFAYPAVLVHGDYWLPNILFSDAGSVSGLLDWERSRDDALVGVDALHLAVFSFCQWRPCEPPDALCMLWGEVCDPLLDQLLSAAAEATQLSRQDLSHVALALWLCHLAGQADQIAYWSPRQIERWVHEPARHIQRWADALPDAQAQANPVISGVR